MGVLMQDFRYAARALFRTRSVSITAILTLAVGIGACSAIFTVVHGILLRPLPYPEPDRIVQAWQIGLKGEPMSTSSANFQDWREQSRSFAALAEFQGIQVSVTGASEPGSRRGIL